MELVLTREYFVKGTNGELFLGDSQICYTIELPWKDNRRQISCIPEGNYHLVIRCNKKFGWHLLVTGVQNRDGILVHPANNALAELKGCIAPVTKLSGEGCGTGTREALKKLLDLVGMAKEKDTICLTIKKKGI